MNGDITCSAQHWCWIVMANSTNTFKRRLDIYWQDQEIIYDFHAQLQGTGSRSEVSVWLNTPPDHTGPHRHN